MNFRMIHVPGAGLIVRLNLRMNHWLVAVPYYGHHNPFIYTYLFTYTSSYIYMIRKIVTSVQFSPDVEPAYPYVNNKLFVSIR